MPKPSRITKTLFSKEQIETRVQKLAQDINKHYKGKELVVVGILKGSFIFLADLVRHITIDHQVEFMALSSYGDSTSSSGNVRIIMDLRRDIVGKHVLIVEDIVDTGHTLHFLLNLLQTRSPASVETCVLLEKPKCLKVPTLKMRWVGFDIEPLFVVGYGLDYAEQYRSVPYIGVLELLEEEKPATTEASSDKKSAKRENEESSTDASKSKKKQKKQK